MTPNSHTRVQVENCCGQPITNVKLCHRYDHDHYDSPLQVDLLAHGEKSKKFVSVGFMTGFLRTGKDYWYVVFECNGYNYSCKDNFYCFLTKDDRDGDVVCQLFKDRMVVRPPRSSSAKVSLDSVQIATAMSGRPFYLISHRANDPEKVTRSLHYGANAVECDLQYKEDHCHSSIYVNHDIKSGCNLDRWLSHASRLGKEQGLSAILFDCKFASASDKEYVKRGMNLLHKTIREYIHDHTGITVVICVASLDDKESFDPILETGLKPNEGISFDYKNCPQAVEDWFKNKKVTNAWYGDGIFTAGFRIQNQDKTNTRQACTIRDEKKSNNNTSNNNSLVGIKKVYHWTLAKDSSIQSAIDDGLDGVMVNASTLHDARKIIVSSDKVHIMRNNMVDHAFSIYSS